MQAVIDEKKQTLTIILPLQPAGTRSASGKTMVVATTRGNQVIPDAVINGKPITIGVNAYYKP